MTITRLIVRRVLALLLAAGTALPAAAPAFADGGWERLLGPR
jgi:hypothetical protein